ncbi:MAG TPA: hypothetical protein VH165_07765 [Kofleriaceae bacterium]|nr:hypothetical protein [Kofleriaceae bacterium]
MASKRRGGPPELRGTLGTLLRTTTDVVRDVLERGAREGRARFDDVRASRRRQDALAELGELVLDLIRRGEIDLDELPEARDLVRQLDDHDAEAGDDGPAPLRASARRRFDDRDADRPDARADRYGTRPDGRDSTHTDGRDSRTDSRDARTDGRDSRTDGGASRRGDPTADSPRLNSRDESRRRSLADEATLDERPVHRRPAADDGTVSSGAALRSTRPTTPGRPLDPADTSRAPTKPIKGLVRPNVGLVRPDADLGRPGVGLGRPDVDGPGEDDDASGPFGSPGPSDSSGSSGSSGSGGPAGASGSSSPSGSGSPSSPSGSASSSGSRNPPSSSGSGSSASSFGSASPFDSPGASAPTPRRLQLAPDPHRKGGISFDDDDLDEYMHPDDVPPRSPLPTPPHDPDDRDP